MNHVFRKFTADEKDLSRRIIRHYANFARYGWVENIFVPNICMFIGRTPVYNKSDNWPQYHRNEPQYYIWNGNIRGRG